MLNKVAAEYWIYGDYGDGFGKPQNAFLHQEREIIFTVTPWQENQRT